jgi:branched-chain amino acid transport system substrate-binding protein
MSLPATAPGAVLFLILALVLAGCGRQESPAPAAPQAVPATVVRLGFAAPLTGPQAHYGVEMRNGVILAVEEANAAGITLGGAPARFELLSEDDEADPAKGTVVAQKLVDAGIRGMLGHFNTGTSIPAARIYAEAGIPQLAMATAPAYTGAGHRTTFRMMTNDVQQGGVMGRFAVEKLGAKRIAVVDDRSAYGQGLATEFEAAARAAGAEVVRREYTTDRATDFAALLTAVKKSGADLLFFGGADAQAAPMAKQMRQLGVKARLVSGEMVRSQNFLEIGGAAAEGTVASIAGLPLERMPRGADYAARYEKRFGSKVEVYSPYAYDGTWTLIEAMKRAGSADPAAVLPELARTDRAGVTSPHIAYDERGDLRASPVTAWVVKGGQWQVLEALGN